MQEGNIKIFPRSKTYGENLDRIKWDTQKDTQGTAEPNVSSSTVVSFLTKSAENTLYHILMGVCEDMTTVITIDTLTLAREIFNDTFDGKIRELRGGSHEDS